MAKKETKKAKKVDKAVDLEYVYEMTKRQTAMINILTNRIIETNERIDRLIEAIDKCKRVKGI